MELIHLPWDSNLFGIKIAKISADKVDEAFYQKVIQSINDFDLVYVFQPHDELNLNVQQESLTPIDIKIVFECELKGGYMIHENIFSYNALTDNREQLYQLGYLSGHASRFKIDEQLPSSAFKKLYQIWMEQSINKAIADDILIYKINDDIAGFVTYKITGSIITIGLIATSPEFTRMQIATYLFKAVAFNGAKMGCTHLQVATQLENGGAISFYLKNNCYIFSKTSIFHFWKK